MCYQKKVLVDTLVNKLSTDSILSKNSYITPVDLINKVDTFYNNAWTKLIVLFALVGVIVPTVIGLIQFIRNKKELKYLKDEILKSHKAEIDEYLNVKLRIMQHASEGVSYSIQAKMYLDKMKYKEAYLDYINSMTCFVIGEDFANFQLIKKEFINECIPKLTKALLTSIDTSYSEYYQSDKLLERINKSGPNYINEWTELKSALDGIK